MSVVSCDNARRASTVPSASLQLTSSRCGTLQVTGVLTVTAVVPTLTYTRSLTTITIRRGASINTAKPQSTLLSVGWAQTHSRKTIVFDPARGKNSGPATPSIATEKAGCTITQALSTRTVTLPSVATEFLDLAVHVVELRRRAIRARELGRREWLPSPAHASPTAAHVGDDAVSRHDALVTKPSATSQPALISKRHPKPLGHLCPAFIFTHR